MSRTVLLILVAFHAAWLFAASPAEAADRSRDGDDRWVPALALVLGFSTLDEQGAVSSADLGGPTPPRPFNDNHKFVTALEVGGSLELATPVLPIPLRPRFFIAGEIVNVSAQQRKIAAEGDPGRLIPPVNTIQFPEDAILGQGSATLGDYDTALYGASVGLSFPFEIGDWKLSVRPSARYLHRRATFQGLVTRAFRVIDAGPTSELVLRGKDSVDIHAIGPALEFEIEAARVDSIAASVYFGGGAYRLLNDRSISFSTTGQDSLGQSTYSANWTAELDRWMYRAGLGIRVKWLGLPPGWFGSGSPAKD